MGRIPGPLTALLVIPLSAAIALPCRADRPQDPPPAVSDVVYPSIKVGGFHDIVYTGDRRIAPRGVSLGQFVLHTNSLLSPNTQFFSEISFSPRTDAGAGSPAAPGYNADIERAIFRYDRSDLLRLSAGRYHTPINWWNTAYHHGQWLQTSVGRPEMVRFGGQFIPVHFVGGLVEGVARFKEFALNYKAGAGNGRSAVVSRAGDAGDNNATTATLLNLAVRPERLYGLLLGGALYEDSILLGTGAKVGETIQSAHACLETETPEILAEFARVRHRPAGGAALHSEAFYVQVAYRLPILERKFKPYFRYERMRVPANEPVLTATPNVSGGLGGIRYDFADLAAVKFEYRNLRRTTGGNSVGFVTQLSYAF